MSFQTIAAEIAARRKALAEDSAENVEQVILGMLTEYQTEPDICIGMTTSNRIVVSMTGGHIKIIGIEEARKMLHHLEDAIKTYERNH